MKDVRFELKQGGGVPGGHYVVIEGDKKPFICPTKEMLSIPLDHRDIVADIGAYTGTFSVICARFPVKEVRGYEPTDRSFEAASKIKLANMKMFNVAVVGDNSTEKTFYLSKGIGVTNSLVPSKAKEAVVVKCMNYDEIIKDATVVKIDIEGGEYELNLIQPHIRAYIIDFHKVGKDWKEKAGTIIKQLEDYGYRCIIQPNFSNGWTQAGSWVKDNFDFGDRQPYHDLMNGKLCVGCNAEINLQAKGLCSACGKVWTKKHRETFLVQ